MKYCCFILDFSCGGSGTFRFGTHHHANCYDLSPEMLKKRIEYHVKENYEAVIDTFIKSESAFIVLEKAKYDIP